MLVRINVAWLWKKKNNNKQHNIYLSLPWSTGREKEGGGRTVVEDPGREYGVKPDRIPPVPFSLGRALTGWPVRKSPSFDFISSTIHMLVKMALKQKFT